MMKRIYKLSLFIFLIALVSGCASTKKSIASFYDLSPECLRIEKDGSVTLVSWGQGKNRKQAIDHAKQKAVDEVLFNVIRDARSNKIVKPLVLVVNAREKYDEYFTTFYSKKKYNKFLDMKEASNNDLDKKANNDEIQVKLVLTVDREGLKSLLEEDLII